MNRIVLALFAVLTATFAAWHVPAGAIGAVQAGATGSAQVSGVDRSFLQRHCFGCHNQRLKTGGLALDTLDLGDVGATPELWEKVVLKLRGGMMPPANRPRPDAAAVMEFVATLERQLDAAAETRHEARPVPMHRLNRAEYANAVRDLLDLEIDTRRLLPPDESSHGFDNIAGTLALSPALLERYMTAARHISRLAVGDPSIGPAFTSRTYSVPMNTVQNDHMGEALPFGTRGGLSIEHPFPLDGEYRIDITLTRSVYEYIVNLDQQHDLDVRVDGRRIEQFTVGGAAPGSAAPVSYSGTIMASKTKIDGEELRGGPFPTQEWDDYRMSADAGLKIRAPLRAGRRAVAVSFVEKTWEGEGVLQPPLREYAATVTETTDLTSKPEGPGVATVTISGPYDATGPGETPSRKRIFTCRPERRAGERACAIEILTTLARRAFRRPVGAADVRPLIALYDEAARSQGFEAGVQAGLERLLLDPEFIFRITASPDPARADLALASRLSFFLWSSIPDDELLESAAKGRLRDTTELERQVRRMLADRRASALVDNFFAQWLSLRSLKGFTPDPNQFPEFDENLRDAFETETLMFLQHQLRGDKSLFELLSANYTFLNERLARHYDITNVTGNRFRMVTLSDPRRAGLLGHGSILSAATSYGNRTSPVLRAKWLLENILGVPPPPPPGDVPPFPDERGADGELRSVRERLAQHRQNPVCANCHAPMDPLGFALENFDAVGKWRTLDANAPIDASGVLVDGTSFTGPTELRHVLLDRRTEFARTAASKLLTYALGRGLDHHDAPVVRQIVRAAAARGDRWSALIAEIVRSRPFRGEPPPSGRTARRQ